MDTFETFGEAIRPVGTGVAARVDHLTVRIR
jgi:hypothetical protein